VGGAALIDLAGTWLAHPAPGRALHSENVEFDADHMIERCRLFLLIALGESVLTSGTALADAPRTLLTVVTGTCALVTIVALWALHFAACCCSVAPSSTCCHRRSICGRSLAGGRCHGWPVSPRWSWLGACPPCSRPAQP